MCTPNPLAPSESVLPSARSGCIDSGHYVFECRSPDVPRPEDELDAKDRWWLVGLELVRTMDPARPTPAHVHSPTAVASGPLQPAMTGTPT